MFLEDGRITFLRGDWVQAINRDERPWKNTAFEAIINESLDFVEVKKIVETPKMKKKRRKVMDMLNAAREKTRQEYLDALRDGRRQRSNTFKPRKGKGSYDRRNRWDD